MTTYYNINPKFYVSVDCIIFGFDEGTASTKTKF